MIYELRIYEALPRKMAALNDRFANHTIRIFEKHDMKSVGYWTEAVGDNTRLVYILAFDSMDDMAQKWAAFLADPEWQRIVAETERDGPLTARVTNRILRPTSYSPLQ